MDQKHIFTNYSKPVVYTCVGLQISRNSCEVLDHAPFQDKLKRHHWEALIWMMRHAELCFEIIADHQVVSHIHNARMVVPFKMMSAPAIGVDCSSKYYGGIAFGCNVFLWCHTDAGFTMSISQVLLKGKTMYEVDDEVVVYLCFLTLGVAVPLRPSDYLLFNLLISHCILSRCKSNDEIMCVSFQYIGIKLTQTET